MIEPAYLQMINLSSILSSIQ